MAAEETITPPVELLAGKYRLTRLLGKGGMGAVWEGVHATLGTRVAVKFIDAQYASSQDVRQRFVNEAKAAARLRSKHVVQVYDQGLLDDGRPYIVMEFLAGEPLDQRLDRLGRLPAAETALILLQVGRALAKAHAAGIVHRDLKPENIFLVWDEEDHTDVAKVVDFGIAKFTQSGPGTASSSTRTGAVLGTPHFMSPEQARGLRSIDHRTDLWALGVIAYRCIVGKLPFQGEAVGDLLVKICTTDPSPPSHEAEDAVAGFDEWTQRALARDPEARFQSAADLTESLCRLAGVEVRGAPLSTLSGGAASSQGPAAARTDPDNETAAPLTQDLPPQRRRAPLFIGLGVAAVVLAGAAALGMRALAGPPVEGAETSAVVPAAQRPAPDDHEPSVTVAPAETEEDPASEETAPAEAKPSESAGAETAPPTVPAPKRQARKPATARRPPSSGPAAAKLAEPKKAPGASGTSPPDKPAPSPEDVLGY